ncbi:MAG: O-antigen ligase family protein, partial [Bryobacterales bacterium]|nr:O-antigen ligase family protein [Bryobacterales bacterium]
WRAQGKRRWVALAAATVGSLAVAASGSRGGMVLVASTWAIASLWRLQTGEGPEEAEVAAHGERMSRRGSLWAGWGARRVGRVMPRWRGVSEWGVAALALSAGIVVLSSVGGMAVLEYRLAHWSALLEGRWDYWRASVEMIAERPVMGWGFGMWPDVYRQFLVHDSGLVVNRAHSDWLEWTAEGGVPMALALGWLLLGALRRAYRAPWAWGLPLLLLYGTVDYTLRAPLVWVVFLVIWLAAGRLHSPNGFPRECQEES